MGPRGSPPERDDRMTVALPTSGRESEPVRVSVTSGRRRVDLVLPGAVPVAELVPELAHGTGLLDHETAHLGAHLVTSEGVVLADGPGLRAQAVRDGAVLAVVLGAAETSTPVYDDLADALADVVELQLPGWSRVARRRAGLVVAVLSLSWGAAAQLAVVPSRGAAGVDVTGALPLVIAVVLLGAGVLLSRIARDVESAITASSCGVGYAAVAGVLLAPGSGSLLEATPAAGVGAVVAGLVGVAGLGPGRLSMLAPVVAGSVVLAISVVVRTTGLEVAVVAAPVLAAAVVVGGVVPRASLALSGLRAPRPGEPGPALDAARVHADTRLAVELVVALGGAVGLLLVSLGIVLVGRGASGLALVTVAALVVLVRSRRHRSRAAVLVGIASAVAGVVAPVTVALAQLEAWRPALAAAAGLAGLVGLTVAVVPEGWLGRARGVDLLEVVMLVALLPLTIWATGLLDTIGR